jgi:hypothetical protein
MIDSTIVHRLRVEYAQLQTALRDQDDQPYADPLRRRGIRFRRRVLQDRLWDAELRLALAR